MAEVIIAGAALQDTSIGAKTATSITTVSSAEGLPLAAGGEFASLIVQILGGVESEPVTADSAAESGKTLPPILPPADAQNPNVTPEMLATLAVPAAPVVTADTDITATSGAEADAENGLSSPGVAASSETANGARRAHATLTEMLATAKQDSAPTTRAERDHRTMAGVIEASTPKVAQDAQSAVAVTDAMPEPPALSSSSAAAVPVVPSAMPAAVAKAPMDSTPIPIHQRGFEQALGDRVVWMTGNRIQSAELQVNPPELGPIEVRISVNNDQASVSFGALQPATRDALEAALPRLRELLSQQGLNLSDVNVSEHSQAQERGETASSSSHPSGSTETANEDVHGSVRITIGMLDVFA